MKKQLMALAAAAAIAPLAANAAEVTWGGEYAVQYFARQERAIVAPATGTIQDSEGFFQTLRIKPTFKLENNISLVTSITLYQNNWLGDHRFTGVTNHAGLGVGGIGSVAGDGSERMQLDLGYLQMPLAGGTLRVGRQAASWGHEFGGSNDRRDRILYMKRLGSVTGIAIYDKRREGSLVEPKDDGNMWLLAAIGNTAGWLWGVDLAYWDGKENADINAGVIGTGNFNAYWLKKVFTVQPFFKGKIGGKVELSGAANFMSGDGYANGVTRNWANDGVWANDSLAYFVKAGMEMGKVKLEGQLAQVIDGGLVGNGWDSFSSLINNTNDNDPNPINIATLGGLGDDKDDQMLVAIRATAAVADGLTIKGALGWFEKKNDHAATSNKASEMFADLGVEYAMSKEVTLFATYGMIMGDEAPVVATNQSRGDATIGAGYSAYAAGIKAKF